MSDVKWIKLSIGIFKDEKITLIEAMPERDTLFYIWIRLLVLAGVCNDGGSIYLSENIPYTDEMLSTLFNRPLNVVRLALDTFQKLEMIEIQENQRIVLINWGKHQNEDALNRLKEGNRKRAREYRKRLTAIGGYDYLQYESVIRKRDNNRCVYCGSTDDLVIDHLVPVILGGDNELDNLVLACRRCNSGKMGRWLEDGDYSFIESWRWEQYQKTKLRLENKNKKEDEERHVTRHARHKHGINKHVLLTDTNYSELCDRYGKQLTDEYIQKVDDYCENHDKTYSNYTNAVHTYIRNDVKRGKLKLDTPVKDKKCPQPDCDGLVLGGVCMKCGWSPSRPGKIE